MVELESASGEDQFRIARFLEKGIETEEVRRRLQRFGVPPHEDLVTWLAWHDGAPGDRPSALPFGWPFTLDDAERDWKDILAVGPGNGIAASMREWFPVVAAGA